MECLTPYPEQLRLRFSFEKKTPSICYAARSQRFPVQKCACAIDISTREWHIFLVICCYFCRHSIYSGTDKFLSISTNCFLSRHELIRAIFRTFGIHKCHKSANNSLSLQCVPHIVHSSCWIVLPKCKINCMEKLIVYSLLKIRVRIRTFVVMVKNQFSARKVFSARKRSFGAGNEPTLFAGNRWKWKKILTHASVMLK